MINGSRIMCIEYLLWQERQLKMQWQRISKSRKIWDLLKFWDWQAECQEKSYVEMLNANGESLSDCARSDIGEDEKDGYDNEDDSEPGRLCEHDQPGWVMGTTSKTAQHCMESFWQMLMRLEESTQLGWGDVAEYFYGSDMKSSTAKLMVQAAIKPPTNKDVAISALTTHGELIESLGTFPGNSHLQQATSCQGSSHMRLGSGKSQSHTSLGCLPPDTIPDSLLIMKLKPLTPTNCYRCKLSHK